MLRRVIWISTAVSLAVLMGVADGCTSVECLPDDGPWSAGYDGATSAQPIVLTAEEALETDRRLSALIGD